MNFVAVTILVLVLILNIAVYDFKENKEDNKKWVVKC